MKCVFISMLATMGIVVALFQATAVEPPPLFECRRATGPIIIDGKADEPAWKEAMVIDGFFQPGKNPPLKSRAGTKARLLWDDDALYFTADMEDSDLFADIKDHDGTLWDNDVFELFFKPSTEQPAYYEFQVNAANATLDVFFPKREMGGFNKYKSHGDFHLISAVVLKGTLNQRDDKDVGWVVEGKIPWKDFSRTGGRPEANAIWKFALCRYDYCIDRKGPELSSCAPLVSKVDFHNSQEYAAMKFVKK
jgi:hypothetical protein